MALVEQRMMLAEDQKESLMHEVEELKQLAKEATNEATNSREERLDDGIERAVRDVCEEEEQRRAELDDASPQFRRSRGTLIQL